jgi:uncharacterized repeat protein (TIGR01451 family)
MWHPERRWFLMRKSDYPKVLWRGVAVIVILLLLLLFGAFAPVAMGQTLVANFTHTAPQCYCTDIYFYGTATGGSPSYNYSWDFGDGNSSTGQNTSHHYGSYGPYTVNLTVTDSGTNTSSISKNVHVWPTPVANFTTNSPQLYCHNITFNDTTTGGTPSYTYDWDFGDGSSSTERNTSHRYFTYGTYDVTLTVTDANGCTNSRMRQVVASGYTGTMDVKKRANVTGWATVGTVIGYNITVYNRGDVNLTSVLVADTLTGLNETIPFLEHGTNQTVNTTYTVTEADVCGVYIENTATAKGTDPCGLLTPTAIGVFGVRSG